MRPVSPAVGPPPEPRAVCTGAPKPVSVALFLTTACNLRCAYCYASAGGNPARFMSADVAATGIDFVARNARERGLGSFSVAYHGGGEPTLHWSVLTGSLAHARNRAGETGLRVDASLTTNGVLTEAQTDWIAGNLQDLTLSFDGLPEVHDRNRLGILGEPSSRRVLDTMKRLDGAGFSYGLRMTVAADQVARLPESVEFACSHSRAERILVEPVFPSGRYEGPAVDPDEFVVAFLAASARARRAARRLCFSGARLGVLTNHFCGLSQDLFALSPDGGVSGCYAVFSERDERAATFFYGRLDREAGGISFDMAVLSRLRRRAVQYRAACRGCFCRWTCAGDCYHKSLLAAGAGACGSGRCRIVQGITEDQILSEIAGSGGLFWRGGASVANSSPNRGSMQTNR